LHHFIEFTQLKKVNKPALYHIAPTILKLLGIKKPKEMGDGLI